jgi:serine/threonine-protein kinase RsbW
MPAREEGRRAALVITQQLDLAEELTEAIEAVGLCTRVVSTLDHLDAHADTRPSIVITDLALQPDEEQWETLAQLFPRSVLWAVCGQNMADVSAVTAAFKHGCRDCLSRPITQEDFSERLAALGRLPGTRPGELDRYMSNEIRLELPSDVSVIEHVVKQLADRCREYRSYGQKTLVNLRIAVSEALSNAIVSGNQGDRSKRVKVWAKVDAWAVKVQVTDEGPGFDPQEIPDPTASGALESSGGRGVFLLKRLADDLTFNETGNALTFTLRSDWEGPKVEEPEDSLSESEAAQPLVNILERLRKSSGADLHLWTENLDGALEHVAPGGPDPRGAVGELHWLQTPGIRYAIEVRGDGQDERWADFARDLLDESIAYEIHGAGGCCQPDTEGRRPGDGRRSRFSVDLRLAERRAGSRRFRGAGPRHRWPRARLVQRVGLGAGFSRESHRAAGRDARPARWTERASGGQARSVDVGSSQLHQPDGRQPHGRRPQPDRPSDGRRRIPRGRNALADDAGSTDR